MTQLDQQILINSRNRQELLKAAVAYARSPQAEDQEMLRRFLTSDDFLNRLDSPEDYEQEARYLRVARVLRTLMGNPAPAAHGTLTALAKSQIFTGDEARVELLIPALAVVRPSPPEAVKFWDTNSQTESPEVHLVIEALCDNGSDPAMALFEKKMVNPGFEPEFLEAWMHDSVLRHRNDLPLLNSCLRLLTGGGLPEEVRPILMESICDYRPEKWYLRDKKPQPPPRAAAPKEAREVQRQICRFGLEHVELNPIQKTAVERTLKELDALDAKPRE